MADSDFIAKTPELEESQDYPLLRSEGLKHVETLGHELWTDYNVHDPGVTILELLCYAITELGYRTGYDVEDLLTVVKDGLPVNPSDFHTARGVLTNHPVSFDDQRKLLIDVGGVRNAWIEKHRSVKYRLDRDEERLEDVPEIELAVEDPDDVVLNGLYDVFIEYEDFVEAEPRLVRTGLLDNTQGGSFIQVGGRGIRFDVGYELLLVAVSVYPETAGQVRVHLVDSDGVAVAEAEAMAEAAGEKTRIPLGFRVEPGEGYRLLATGTAVELFRTPSPTPDYPYSVERLLELTEGIGGAAYFFFYDWEVSYAVEPESADDSAPPATTTTREDVRLAVLERLHAHRNLCEDFVNVCDLAIEEIALCADIELQPGADVEEVLAEIFYRVELHVSPAVRFYTIEELLEKGKTVDEIFEGPPLDHGFIDDEEFRAIKRRCELRTSDVVRILMDVPGVVAIKRIALLSFVDEVLRTQEDWILELATDKFRAPELNPERSKVVFYKNDLPYFAHRGTVEELLEEKRSADLASKLKGHPKDLPVPVGEAKDLEVYEPVQNELPAVYAVGQVRVPESRSELRKAQARQLKAYLMFFEQLLANHLAQLANVRDLFSWSGTSITTYFTQEVSGIAGLEEIYDQKLLDQDYGGSLATALEAIVEDDETAGKRRNRFLAHLVARFAEDFTEYDLLMESLLKKGLRERLIGDKRAFLADYPRVGGERGQGRDYREPFPGGEDGLSGFTRRVYRLLGFQEVSSRQLAGHFKIEEAPGGWHFVLEAEGGGNLFESIECEQKSAVEVLLDAAFELGSKAESYELTDDESAWELLLKCPGEDDRVLGATTSAEVRDEVVEAFRQTNEAEGFHVVEHILLRKRTTGDVFMQVQLGEPGECVKVEDPYSFRATVLLPSWPRRFQDLKFRRFVEDTLRREAPAHVYLKICWISHRQMTELEECYEGWTRELATLAEGLGQCRSDEDPLATVPLDGALPLPPSGPEHQDYSEALAELIEKLHSLVTVHPLARLHDCQETSGDSPMITLNNTNLGTF